MYDTIHSYLRQDLVDDTHLLSEIPIHLDEVTEHQKDGAIYYTGKKSGLNIFVNEGLISIKGSLAKYHFGNNLETLTRENTQESLSKLSDELHLNLDESIVTRLDFAENFIMEHKPKAYYPYLSECKYFSRSPYLNSLYYRNGSRVLAFYDKTLEMKSKLPKEWKGKNILRYEVRYIDRIAHQLKEPRVTLSTLYSEPFYLKINDRYLESFKSIHKAPEFIMNTKSIKTTNDILYSLLVKEISPEQVYNYIDELKERDVLERSEYYSRAKSEYRKMRNKFSSSDNSNSLLSELEGKILALKI